VTHKSDSAARPLLGWREWLSLPELGIEQIKAKVDTGARSSSLHAFDVRIAKEDGQSWVSFIIHPIQGRNVPAIAAKARLIEHRQVRSSSGHVESRPVIETTVCLGGRTWQIELTLTNRDEMGFRMLLGRSAIARKFVVDPARSFLG
jgi:hypothetical protein